MVDTDKIILNLRREVASWFQFPKRDMVDTDLFHGDEREFILTLVSIP